MTLRELRSRVEKTKYIIYENIIHQKEVYL